MENEVINTLQDGERVTSSYAEVFFDDDYCDYTLLTPDSSKNVKVKSKTRFDEDESDWVSPSDLLIGIVDLKPPFTSKITRGQAHKGILAIGDDILNIEREKFMKFLTNLIYENDCAWNHVLQFEKEAVVKKVQKIYQQIFEDKSKTMTKEIMLYFEQSLQELEKNIKGQVDDVLMSTHASIVSKLNIDIKKKLKDEKTILENVLKKQYNSEVGKLKKYYRLLLKNEEVRCNQLINRAIIERNDAVKAFIRQIEAENTSSTMYVMCTERKKCKIKQFFLENCQTQELKEKYQKLKEKQDVIDMFKDKEIHIAQINSDWEEKIKKILQLFLKFISFSLQLLPEQSSFLLNFEKMVVLQLNDMHKMPLNKSSILVDAENLNNTFKFEEIGETKEECIKEPFVMSGGPDTPTTEYGSRETIPDGVDLPAVRIQRQLIYAKCHHYEEIKARLEAERCKCMDPPKPIEVDEPKPGPSKPMPFKRKSDDTLVEEPYEYLLIDDIERYNECPARRCQHWVNSLSFPNLNAYLDFDDEKYKRVVAILDKPTKPADVPQFIDPKEIVFRELPFSATKEPYHNVETQYSSQESLFIPDVTCPCFNENVPQKLPSHYRIEESPSKIIADNMTRRKISLRRLFQQNPELMKTLTDESFDFIF